MSLSSENFTEQNIEQFTLEMINPHNPKDKYSLNLGLKNIPDNLIAKIADDKAFVKALNQMATSNNKKVKKTFARYVALYIDRNGLSAKFKQDIRLIEQIANGVNWSNQFYQHQLALYSQKVKIKSKASDIEINVLNMLIHLYKMLSGLKYNNYCSELLEISKVAKNNCEKTNIQELKHLLQAS